MNLFDYENFLDYETSAINPDEAEPKLSSPKDERSSLLIFEIWIIKLYSFALKQFHS